MMHDTNGTIFRAIAAVAAAAALAGCFEYAGGGGGGGGGGSAPSDAGVADVFLQNLSFNVPATVTVGKLPAANDDGGVTVIPLPGSTGPMVVNLPPADGGSAGGSTTVNFQIPWQGGGISSINIGFGGNQFFNIPVPAAAGQTSGVINVPAEVSNDMCAQLNTTDVCHQIQCYEQVVTPQGTFSKASALQMVINCTGADCSGNSADAGVTTCNNLTTAGGDAPETHTVDLGKTSGTFDFSYSMMSIEDRMVVTYGGQVLLDTGCVSGSQTSSLTYSGSTTQVTVQVMPTCDPADTGSGTAWDFTVGCP